MTGFSRRIIAQCYDRIECLFLKDYSTARTTIEQHISFTGKEILLDMGGGTGYIAQQFYKKVGTAINIDISKHMLMQQNNTSIPRIQANIIHIPLQNTSVDIVLLINTLHHINERYHSTVIKEGYRLLKNNGLFLIIDLYYPMTTLNKLFTLIEEFTVGKTYHTSHLSVQNYLKQAGFTDSMVNYLDNHNWNYAIIAKK